VQRVARCDELEFDLDRALHPLAERVHRLALGCVTGPRDEG
jgi:hypothetical protein